MASVVEVETARVVDVLYSCARQVELLALLPTKPRRLRDSIKSMDRAAMSPAEARVYDAILLLADAEEAAAVEAADGARGDDFGVSTSAGGASGVLRPAARRAAMAVRAVVRGLDRLEKQMRAKAAKAERDAEGIRGVGGVVAAAANVKEWLATADELDHDEDEDHHEDELDDDGEASDRRRQHERGGGKEAEDAGDVEDEGEDGAHHGHDDEYDGHHRHHRAGGGGGGSSRDKAGMRGAAQSGIGMLSILRTRADTLRVRRARGSPRDAVGHLVPTSSGGSGAGSPHAGLASPSRAGSAALGGSGAGWLSAGGLGSAGEGVVGAGASSDSSSLPLERVALVLAELIVAAGTRLRTNAEQDAIRADFERTVSERIRQARAQAELLVEERRRIKMRHEAETERLGDLTEKLRVEREDVQSRAERGQRELEAHVRASLQRLHEAHEAEMTALRVASAKTSASLSEAEARDVESESKLRKRRQQMLTELGGRLLHDYDSEMRRRQARIDALERDNAELERSIAALEDHDALMTRNRELAREELQVKTLHKEAAEKAFRTKYNLPAMRIQTWFRKLQAKWATRKTTKKASAKGGRKA